MKTLVILLFFCGVAFAQTTTIQWTDTTTSSGKPDRAVSQAYPLPVQLFGTNTINTDNIGIDTVRIASSGNGTLTITQKPDTAIIWAVDTVNAAIDTLHKFANWTLTNLSSKFPNECQLTITADSTIEVSTVIGFTAGLTFRVKTGESWTTKRLSGITTIYIRRHSSITGVTTWRADISGF